MANITVVSKIRFVAGIAPVILLIASPLLALAFLSSARFRPISEMTRSPR